jgi:hypothetical protein
MKNKNGFLLGEETVKIVIAVICIGFLVTLLVLIYLSATGTQKTKEAVTFMEVLKKNIQTVDEGGEINDEGILIQNPAGWYVFSFVDNDKKPNQCLGENCICICAADWFTQIKTCDSKGACIPVSNLKKFNTFKIDNGGTFIFLKKINNFISISKK